MHIGTNGTNKDSKTEAVMFPPPGMTTSQFDTSPVPIGTTGYITFCKEFKYLGSYVTSDLNDTFDVKNELFRLLRP
eukprot:11371301-Ditylum_brightwellii.AAC.1